MIKAIIVDDEKSSCTILNIRLQKYKDELEVVAMAENIQEAEVLINELNPDLVFLDIQMPGGSGFDLLKAFPEPNFEVVFVTAYNEYALKALKLSALDYLLKPIEPNELDGCIEKVKAAINSANNKLTTSSRLKVLEINIENKNPKLFKIVLPLINGFKVINLSEVVYCKAESNYTSLYLTNKSQHVVSKTLKEFEELLGDFLFFRVHNSYLINLNHVVGYKKGIAGSVIMSNGSELKVSRNKKADFQNLFLNN